MSPAGLPFPVSPAKLLALRARLSALGIEEADLDESFVRSGGKGGQNVNKVATCVVLVHRPSGTAVKCQQERRQGLNRYLARRLLADKIEQSRLGIERARAREVDRIRRQKRRRSRRAKQKMGRKRGQDRAGFGRRRPSTRGCPFPRARLTEAANLDPRVRTPCAA